MMRRAYAALIALLAALPLTTARGADEGLLDQLLPLLAQRRHGEADFTQKQYLGVLKQPLESSGQLVYDAPDHLEQRTLLPRAQQVVLDHGTLTMQLGKRTRSVTLADYPQLAALIDSIRATLAGDRAALEKLFEVRTQGTLDHWQLELQPRDTQLGASLAHIDLSGERDAVLAVQVVQRNGDHSEMQIHPRE